MRLNCKYKAWTKGQKGHTHSVRTLPKMYSDKVVKYSSIKQRDRDRDRERERVMEVQRLTRRGQKNLLQEAKSSDQTLGRSSALCRH